MKSSVESETAVLAWQSAVLQSAYNHGLDEDYHDEDGTDWDRLVRELEDFFGYLPEAWDHPLLKQIKAAYRRGRKDATS